MRGDLVDLNFKAFNRQINSVMVKCLEIPHYAYSSRWQQAKETNSQTMLLIKILFARNRVIGGLCLLLTVFSCNSEVESVKETNRQVKIDTLNYFYDNDVKRSGLTIIPHINDTIHGDLQGFDSLGKLVFSQRYNMGLLNGYSVLYDDESDEIAQRKLYKNDSLIVTYLYSDSLDKPKAIVHPVVISPDTICDSIYVGKYRLPLSLNSDILLVIGKRKDEGSDFEEIYSVLEPNEEGVFAYEAQVQNKGLNLVQGTFIHRDQKLDTISVHGAGFEDYYFRKDCN